jgi:C4-dicarboxylate transporter DctM subunit
LRAYQTLENLVGVAQLIVDHLNSPTLMSLPLFVMAATFMRVGGHAEPHKF